VNSKAPKKREIIYLSIYSFNHNNTTNNYFNKTNNNNNKTTTTIEQREQQQNIENLIERNLYGV